MAEQVPSFLKDILWDGQLPQDLAGLDWNFARYIREEALERFLSHGLPTQNEEDWKYTSLQDIEKGHWQRTLGDSNIQDTIPFLASEKAARIVFVNGHYSFAHTTKKLPPGLHISSLQEALEKRDEHLHDFLNEAPAESWQDLNTALFEDGLLIEVDAGVMIEKPVELVLLAAATASPINMNMRVMVHLGEGAKLDFVQIQDALGRSGIANFATVVCSAHLAQGARFRRVVYQNSSHQAIRLMHEEAHLAENAEVDYTLLQLGGHLVRQSARITHAGSNARSTIRAVNLADDSHIDLITDMRHNAPNTTSRQDVRALSRNKGHAVFQGKVTVAEAAQKTSAQQMHRGMLLSDDALVDAKPSLEIYADDVQCGHGSTCGALDDDALFYLQSRGVPRAQAEAMLIEAFVLALFEEESVPARDNILTRLSQRLSA
jgi:Fe-S cluster assembly protein SufD